MGALLGTHESKKLRSHQAIARAAGRPYDPARLELFDALFSRLRTETFPELPDTATAGLARENFAFFEAYFSNYIEGTTFLVSEAEEIVFHKVSHSESARRFAGCPRYIPSRDAAS